MCVVVRYCMPPNCGRFSDGQDLACDGKLLSDRRRHRTLAGLKVGATTRPALTFRPLVDPCAVRYGVIVATATFAASSFAIACWISGFR